MRWLDAEYPGYGFAAHKGYGGGKGEQEAAIRKIGRLSPVHRLSVHPKVYAKVEQAQICAELRAEPMFSVSLGSKELCRSNLIGWLATEHPAATTVASSSTLTPDTDGRVNSPPFRRGLSVW